MNLSVRIFLGYFVLVGFAIWFVMRTFSAELVPGMRQSLEEVLVDTANLLAELVAEEVDQRRLQSGHFADAMASFAERRIDARIWFLRKRDPNLIVYITDAKGIVLYDSRGRDVGKDYSQWNDVLLTLRGKYGARTTREDEKDDFSSVMYVAAPIYRHDELIGVVTVGKPSVTVQPFVESATRNIKEKGVLMILAALAVGIIITYWLSMSIRKLTAYARAVRDGERPSVPRLREKELAQLADAMDAMRRELEGKDYVENYLHILTHEMKSPLAAIRGTAELLDEEMPLADRQRFIANIRSEANRLHQVVEQLLQLAVVEKQQGLSNPESVDVTAMIEELCEARQWRAEQDGIRFELDLRQGVRLVAERFLLRQALGNLIDNAIDFSPRGGTIRFADRVHEGVWSLSITDQGPGVPEYALDRVFERFYSLPRPATDARSSGLGLSFVREVAQVHGGEVQLANAPRQGAVATLSLPIKPKNDPV
ncbi:two-component system sensor histidine kinase CreC [Thiosocius teredinicola]|uniref:two-component system sensor histidine kinase CreC n=1 Tax=Thiosocius teredinicola TaxID=1973002 RepID=UPI00099121D9